VNQCQYYKTLKLYTVYYFLQTALHASGDNSPIIRSTCKL